MFYCINQFENFEVVLNYKPFKNRKKETSLIYWWTTRISRIKTTCTSDEFLNNMKQLKNFYKRISFQTLGELSTKLVSYFLIYYLYNIHELSIESSHVFIYIYFMEYIKTIKINHDKSLNWVPSTDTWFQVIENTINNIFNFWGFHSSSMKAYSVLFLKSIRVYEFVLLSLM